MEVYVKETLHVLDYQDNIKHTIFNSDDHITAGYAYNINISEANTGYSDLKFEMPHDIINDKGEKVHNPMLELMVPLVKLRYHRQVFYVGSEKISVREPQGYGDKTVYIEKVYDNEYPNNIIEDYVMDYIVQPVDKKRDVHKISTSFTAMDYPRFNLSKKRVGLTIGQDTLTKPEWTLYTNEPMSVPGKIKYIKWNENYINTRVVKDTWNPTTAIDFPLKKEDILSLLNNGNVWPYGLLATAFYWEIEETGRFKGVMYKEKGFLVLQLYDFYAQTTEGMDLNESLEWVDLNRYSWDWTQLYEMDDYLCPNNALNYLYHILNGTNWSVALRQDGTPDVDIIKTKVANPRGSTVSHEWVDLQSNITVSNGNCYNAITALCKELQVYPVFDCIHRTVALRQFAGKNYGLTYSLGSNLKDDTTKLDGEKVITKLYCTGGKDYNGDSNINIGDAERSYISNFTGFYNTVESLPTSDFGGFYAIVDTTIPDTAFYAPEYYYTMENDKHVIGKRYNSTKRVHDLNVQQYWKVGTNRKVYYWYNNSWNIGTQLSDTLWEINRGGDRYIIDAVAGTIGNWSPNDPMYIMGRSPAKTNYILNFEWMYRNKWITKEQILELYQYEEDINNLNLFFVDRYNKDYKNTRAKYNEAINNFDIAQDGFESTLNTMENKYYNNATKFSEGYTYCFHKAPQGTYTKRIEGHDLHYIKLFHCYNSNCLKTIALSPRTNNRPPLDKAVCECGSVDVVNEEIYIPTYDDFHFVYPEALYPVTDIDTVNDKNYRYAPHLKGDYLSMLISMDKLVKSTRTQSDDDATTWDIAEYEDVISMINEIPFQGADIVGTDGYDYKINNVYVRSTSGKIENWNDDINKYIDNFGKMKQFWRDAEALHKRILELDEQYESWKERIDNLHAIIQEKFGDYLIEGNYINNEQPYAGLLFNESLEASDKASIPKITYDLNVVDSSGLAEYRSTHSILRQCIHCGWIEEDPYWELCPVCGGKLESIYDVYNDLVRKLHSVGQIVPKAGDYVTIYDEPMGMYGVPGLITDITRCLDNPKNNGIKVNMSYTDDKELVGNIITATNTVLSNADIYARTTVLRADGTIDPTALVNSFNNNQDSIAIVGTNGNMLLDSTGMRVTNSSNPHKAMKYSGNGIFTTSNFSTDSNEAVLWERILSDEGINASYIRSGSIDTNRLTILSGKYGKVTLDQYGLTVRRNTEGLTHLQPFDKTKAKKDALYAEDWGLRNNINSFIGVLPDNSSLIYTKGFLIAEEGSNIANWVTDNSGFYHLKSGTTTGAKDLWLSPTGLQRSNFSGSATLGGNANPYFVLYANDNFGVTTSGKLYATGAYISGDLIADSLTLNSSIRIPANNLDTPELETYIRTEVDADHILYQGDITHNRTNITRDGVTIGYADTVTYVDGYGVSHSYTTYTAEDDEGYVYTNVGLGSQNTSHTNNYVRISKTGLLTADNATIYGTIYAGGGAIAGWELGSVNVNVSGFQTGTYKYFGNHNNDVTSTSNFYLASDPFYNTWSHDSDKHKWFLYFKNKFGIDNTGKLYADGATVSGSITASSGKIGNWSIKSNGMLEGHASKYVHLNPNNSNLAPFGIATDSAGNNATFAIGWDGTLTWNRGYISCGYNEDYQENGIFLATISGYSVFIGTSGVYIGSHRIWPLS